MKKLIILSLALLVLISGCISSPLAEMNEQKIKELAKTVEQMDKTYDLTIILSCQQGCLYMFAELSKEPMYKDVIKNATDPPLPREILQNIVLKCEKECDSIE